MQRLRLKFSRGDALKFLSHLDLMRLWERAMRRSGLPLAYSEGFSPHPKISLAAPLPVGVTSQSEIMDVFLTCNVPANLFIQMVQPQLPRGIEILDIMQVGLQLPALQSILRFAEYIVEIETDKGSSQIENDLILLLAKKSIPWHHKRDTGDKYYDLRLLIDSLWLADKIDTGCAIGMRLHCGAEGTGRPEQVARALGFNETPVSIKRVNLIFD